MKRGLIINILLLVISSIAAQAQPKVTMNPGVPRNIVILVGSGMGVAQITEGELKNKDKLSAMEKMPFAGLMKTWSSTEIVSDPFASMTAIACGKKTMNGAIGIGPDYKPMKNLFEFAKDKGMSTGAITTNSITRSSLLPFLMHKEDLQPDEKIALSLTETDVNLLMGGGRKYFTKRSDKMDLVSTFNAKGYAYEDKSKKAGNVKGNKILALVEEDMLPSGSLRKGFLPEASGNAMNQLMINTKGYFLVVETSQLDYAANVNAPSMIADEIIDLDKTLEEIIKNAGNETLVLVMGNVESGGLVVSGGTIKEGKTNISFSTKGNTASMVPVLAFGPGAEKFSGIYDNTTVFTKLLEFVNVRR